MHILFDHDCRQVNTAEFAEFFETHKIEVAYAVALLGSHSLIDNQVCG